MLDKVRIRGSILEAIVLIEVAVRLGLDPQEGDSAFVLLDLTQASCDVRHDYVWPVLRHTHCPPWLVSALHGAFSSQYGVFEHQGALSNMFVFARGIQQGCFVSVILFSILRDSFLR